MNPSLSSVHPAFEGLQPASVWTHFSALCAIPRSSKHEGALVEHLRVWARKLGLESAVDPAGNLILRKSASPGYENAPGVVLQAHLDMVCQKNDGVAHDFLRDPIIPVRRDGWIVAEQTTLGADNGIGAALILAALEAPGLAHGPIEALLTIDEEAGMGGARGLESSSLDGRILINLDTEDWGVLYLGCAGSVDVSVQRTGVAEALPAGYQGVRIELRGLRGGHSGINIHEGRGNAIKLLVRVLNHLEKRTGLRLASLRGGSARNALPREAFAELLVPVAEVAGLKAFLAEQQQLLRTELAGIDDGLELTLAPCAPESVLAEADQKAWMAALHAAPLGVRRMSVETPGVVETSDNLGVVSLSATEGTATFMVRSLVDSAADDLADQIVSLFELAGMRAELSGRNPGWRPNPSSPLLARCRNVFRTTFGEDATICVVHAGLECGLIGSKYPGMDMVSFGPTIHGAHAPGETVEIASVERCWHLLKTLLAELR